MSGSVGLTVFRPYPHLFVTSLISFTDMEHQYPYPCKSRRFDKISNLHSILGQFLRKQVFDVMIIPDAMRHSSNH